ncbi:MAG: hypothetical protein H6714_11290 [Myxococcales bacterium]|nr:hypothetical protein [Myxococcales bacterium]
MDKATRKYLASYAEPSIKFASRLPGCFDHVIVIPCFSEGNGLLAALSSLPIDTRSSTLVIVVLNASSLASIEQLRANQLTLESLRAAFPSFETIANAPPCTLFQTPVGSLLLIEHSKVPWLLPAKESVGLARKIGCDLAVALGALGKLNANWIHCTDADVQLHPDYFVQSVSRMPDVAAAYYPFRHNTETSLRYEVSLRYLVLGLAYAGSPYAHHTIGSTLIISRSHYTKVRGFPKREAGEDYYMLNKLAKVGRILRLSGPPLTLSGRDSDRVPFGTGPAVGRLRHRPDEPLVYHPMIFTKLREHLEALGNDPRTHVSFDAFQTLKWIHRLRDQSLPSIGFRQACSDAVFVKARSSKEEPSVVELCNALERQEHELSPLTGLAHGSA